MASAHSYQPPTPAGSTASPPPLSTLHHSIPSLHHDDSPSAQQHWNNNHSAGRYSSAPAPSRYDTSPHLGASYSSLAPLPPPLVAPDSSSSSSASLSQRYPHLDARPLPSPPQYQHYAPHHQPSSQQQTYTLPLPLPSHPGPLPPMRLRPDAPLDPVYHASSSSSALRRAYDPEQVRRRSWSYDSAGNSTPHGNGAGGAPHSNGHNASSSSAFNGLLGAPVNGGGHSGGAASPRGMQALSMAAAASSSSSSPGTTFGRSLQSVVAPLPLPPSQQQQQPPYQRQHEHQVPATTSDSSDEGSLDGNGKKKRKRRRKATEEPRDLAARKFTCASCGKMFARPSALSTHERSHSKEKPHVCPVPTCQRPFAVSANLRRHLNLIHPGMTLTRDASGVYGLDPNNSDPTGGVAPSSGVAPLELPNATGGGGAARTQKTEVDQLHDD